MQLLIRNGNVIDPKNKVDGIYDVFVKDGKVCKIEYSIDIDGLGLSEKEKEELKVVDATGL